ncbi:MAG: NUDIX hydrolase [Gammaproteobacteria bacterium]
MSELWKPNTVVATIVERDGRFLLVEEEADGRAVFNQPAGHLDDGETLLDAARRETLEESGWHVEPFDLVGIYLVAPPGKDITYLRFCFRARALSFAADRKLDKEIIRAVWMTREEIVAEQSRHRSPLVLRCIDDAIAGQRHSLSLIHDLRFGG